jgi:hypothetical protein
LYATPFLVGMGEGHQREQQIPRPLGLGMTA